MKTKTRIRTRCLVCGEPVHFEKYPRLGEIITCQFCDEKLEVVRLDPIVLDWPWDVDIAVENDYIEEDHGY